MAIRRGEIYDDNHFIVCVKVGKVMERFRIKLGMTEGGDDYYLFNLRF